jgi:hypothetical protein
MQIAISMFIYAFESLNKRRLRQHGRQVAEAGVD